MKTDTIVFQSVGHRVTIGCCVIALGIAFLFSSGGSIAQAHEEAGTGGPVVDWVDEESGLTYAHYATHDALIESGSHGHTAHWSLLDSIPPTGPVVVKYFVDTSHDSLSGAQVDRINDAANVWSNTGANLTLQRVFSDAEADIHVHETDVSGLGLASFSYQNHSAIGYSDGHPHHKLSSGNLTLSMDARGDWWTEPGGIPSGFFDSNRYDYMSVAIQEFGHLLGLDHNPDGNSPMNGSLPPKTGRRTLQGHDLDSIRHLYPAAEVVVTLPPTIGLVPTSSSASSEFDGSFAVGNLHDGSVTATSIGTADFQENQYAGAGDGPHVIVYDMDSSVDFDGIYYAQRLGGDPATDKVTSIEFWATNTNPGSAGTGMSILGTAVDNILSVTNTANNNMTEYGLGETLSGQYVVMRITGNGGNPGGSELQLRAATLPPTIGLVPTSSSASSEFDGSFAVGNLHDGSVTATSIGTADFQENQYAGAGDGPHVIVYDMDSSVDFDGIYYAQRLGGDPATDKVTSIEFWVTNTNPGSAGTGMSILSTAVDNILSVTNTANNNMTEYGLGETLSGQYVVMRITGNGGNPGGSELQLRAGIIPEPSTAMMALLGLTSLIAFSRRRRVL